MNIIPQSHEFLVPLTPEVGQQMLQVIELAARTCYQSADAIGPGTAEKMVRMLVRRGHGAMLEHASISVRFHTDRAIANEMVRHRLASFAQESTRYCNYSKGKFGSQITVVEPFPVEENPHAYAEWFNSVMQDEKAYFKMLQLHATPEQARDVLPLSLATELVTTANLREWRHILSLRTEEAAHPKIRALMKGVLKDFKQNIPIVFDDIEVEE